MTIQELQAKARELVAGGSSIEDDSFWSELGTGIETVVNNSISGVITSKEKILGEKKALQEKYKEIEDKYKSFEENGLSLEEISKMKEEYELLKSKGDSTSADMKELQEKFYDQGKRQMKQELEPQLKEFQAKLKTYEKEKTELFSKYRRKLKENTINDTLKKLGVQADDFWIAGFYQQSEDEYIETEDRISIAVPNPIDPRGPKIPLEDWAKVFPSTSQGKSLIPAPMNTGGSAMGSDGKPIQKKSLNDELNAFFKG